MKKSYAQAIMTISDANKIALWLAVVSVIMSAILAWILIHYPESEKIIWGVGHVIWFIVILVVGQLAKNYYHKKHSYLLRVTRRGL